MCDYSLELYRSRPAVHEEQYTLQRFRSGTIGFISGTDCDPAVCLPTGARLRLQGLSERVQRTFAVRPAEEVVLVRLPVRGHTHRDGVRFANGREVLLQGLNVGLSAMLAPRDLAEILDLNVKAERDLVDA